MIVVREFEKCRITLMHTHANKTSHTSSLCKGILASVRHYVKHIKGAYLHLQNIKPTDVLFGGKLYLI